MIETVSQYIYIEKNTFLGGGGYALHCTQLVYVYGVMAGLMLMPAPAVDDDCRPSPATQPVGVWMPAPAWCLRNERTANGCVIALASL